MDEYSTGMDPEVRRYFKKLVNSLSYGLLWLMFTVTAGIFFRLGEIAGGIKWYNVLFYIAALTGFVFLLRYLHKLWGRSVRA